MAASARWKTPPQRVIDRANRLTRAEPAPGGRAGTWIAWRG